MADDVGESVSDTWHCSVEWLGATWPNQWLPRGTPILVNKVCVKRLWRPWGSTPRPPHHIKL
jgi:hypothetical protein